MKTLIVHYGPGPNSYTRKTVDLVRELLTDSTEISELDLVAQQPPLFDQVSMSAYVNRNYRGESIDASQLGNLQFMDDMTEQLLSADILILAFPMYNFQIPASIKAWIDGVVQSRKTFRNTDYGSEGLTKIQHAIILMSTGTTRIDSSKDFASPYLRYVLNFIGVKNIYIHGVTQTSQVLDNSPKFADLQTELSKLFSQIYE